MGLFANVKNFMGFGSLEDYDDEDELDYRAEEEEEAEEEAPKRKAGEKAYVKKKKTSNVIPLTTRNDNANVQILKPQVFEDSYKIANVVRSNLVAIFDVAEMSNSEVATRVVDFVSGSVFALGGNMRKIAPGIFVASPRQVDISGDTIGEHTRNNFNWDYGNSR